MKTCKACQTEIQEAVKKCPHCQTFQNWWYGIIPMLPLLLILLAFGVLPRFILQNNRELDFEELDQLVSFKKISEEVIESEKEKVLPKLKILLEVKNLTDRNLEHPAFEVTITDAEGALRDVVNEVLYQKKIRANESTNIALTINPHIAGENFSTEIKLTEIKED